MTKTTIQYSGEKNRVKKKCSLVKGEEKKNPFKTAAIMNQIRLTVYYRYYEYNKKKNVYFSSVNENFEK